jgi:hypothetical protein
MTSQSGYLERPTPSSLADVIEVILDKGLVIDAYARVSLVGIELVTIDARIVIASVDTYLRFAEATNRLELDESQTTVVDLLADSAGKVVEKVAKKVVEEKVRGVMDTASEAGRVLLSWTLERARALLERLTTFAKRVFRYVAEHAPRVPIPEILDHFGVANRQKLEGRMSSLGSALRKMPGAVNPMPAVDDDYVMKPEDARVFLRAIRDLRS